MINPDITFKDYDPAIHQDIWGWQLAIGQTVAVSWSDRTLNFGVIIGFTPKKVRIMLHGYQVDKTMFPKAMAIKCLG